MRTWLEHLKKSLAIVVVLAVMVGTISMTAAAPRTQKLPGNTPTFTPPPVDLPVIQGPPAVTNLWTSFWLWLTTVIH